MKIGFFQFDIVYGDKQANLEKVTQALMQSDFDIILLPELFSTGCIFLTAQQAHDFAEAVPEGETIQSLIAIAQAKTAYIVAGIVEREGDQLYNSAVIVGPEGLVGKHRKVNLAPPDIHCFNPGDRFDIFEVLGRKIGILLCYDIWFPEAAKALVDQGAEIIFNPSNFCGEDSLEVIIQRAKELSVYTISANRLGMDHDTGTGVAFIGSSLIVNPEGAVLGRAGSDDLLVVKSIDL